MSDGARHAAQATGLPAGYLPLFPFASLTDVHAWQASYQSGGHQPWHRSPDLTATAFAAFLGYSDVTQIAKARSAAETHTWRSASNCRTAPSARPPSST